MTYTVEQIADWFIAQSRAEARINDNVEPITKMKLQSLLYLAQGINLDVHDKRLFDGPFYAFEHGPITKDIQDKYSGKSLPEFEESIPDNRQTELADNFDRISTDKDTSEVLNYVWEQYSPYTTSALCNIFHNPNGPWAKVYDSDSLGIEMNDDDIKKYFNNVVDVD